MNLPPTDVDVAMESAVSATGLQHKLVLSSDRSAPVVFLVHGRAGTYNVMWTFRRCVPDECTIIAPQAFLPDTVGGFSWWSVAPDEQKPREQIEYAEERLKQFFERALDYYRLTPRVRLALGFSQGGGLLSKLLQRNPRAFGGIGLLASFVLKEMGLPTDWQSNTRIFMAHGTKDGIVPVDLARQGAVYFRERGLAVEWVEDDVGHKVGTTGMRALRNWISALTVPDLPK